MRDILAEDLKSLEKRYNKQLEFIGLDNETLSLKLRQKNNEVKRLNENYKSLLVNNERNIFSHFAFLSLIKEA